MRPFIRLLHPLAFLLFAVVVAAPQTTAGQSKAAATISGTVTLNGKPARGIIVIALQGASYEKKPSASAITDSEGHYQLLGIAGGNCVITVDAPSLAGGGLEDEETRISKSVHVGDGEAITGIDLAIYPGGVITGRITEAGGRPVIGENVKLLPVKRGPKGDEDVTYGLPSMGDKLSVKTDDRGEYRAYGLPPGRYKVNIGVAHSLSRKWWFGHVPLPLTYYPSATDTRKADIVEIAAGAEVTGIDIVIMRPLADKKRLYKASGRIVDAATGKPLAHVDFSYSKKTSLEDFRLGKDDDYISDSGESDAQGDFHIQDLPSGQYEIKVTAREKSPWFGKNSEFEIAGADAEGVELRAESAGSISGTVVLEGAYDSDIRTQLAKVQVAENPIMSFLGEDKPPSADNSFRLAGLGPGTHRLMIDSDSMRAGFEVLRVERTDRALTKREELLHSLELGASENLTGVRVVVACYKGSIRGQIQIVGGTLPAGARMEVSATPINAPPKDISWAGSHKALALMMSRWRRGNIDARGHFLIERLPPGEFEIDLDVYLKPRSYDDDDALPVTIKKIVTLTGDEPDITLVFDLNQKPEDK